MKRFIQVFLVLFLMFGLVACGGEVPHEHNFSSEFQKDETYHWKTCECDEIGEKAEHTFTEWEYVTEDESGKYEERTCTVCGYIDTKITICEHDFELITVPGTCKEEGYMTSKCSKCGFVNNHNILPKEEHNFGSWVVTKEATCTEEGSQYRICDGCQLKEEDTIEKLDHEFVKEFKYDSKEHWIECKNCNEKTNVEEHSFSDWTVISEDDNGKKEERTCETCGYKETRVEGCEHNYVSSSEKSTCDKKGYEKVECSKCGHVSEYKELPLTSHNYGEWKVVEEATCTKEGKKIRTCSTCQKEESQIISKESHNHSTDYKYDSTTHWRECECGHKTDNNAHDFSKWTVVSEDQNGKKEERTCNTCGYKESKVSECEHNYVTTTEPSTCSKKGYEKVECSKCGHVKSNKELPLAEHSYGEFVIVKEATCAEEGTKEKTCSKCGDKVQETIQKTSHDYEVIITKKPTCSEEGTATTKCKVCNESSEQKIDKVEHTFGEGVVVSESTCKDHGKEEVTCLICGHKQQRDLELTYHDFGEYVVTKQPTLEEEGIETSTCSVCGATREYSIDKLLGYTVTVSGGTVNRKGENIDQSTIYVAEGEIVEIKAKEYSGYTFFQWFSDGSEIIPTSTFELFVTRNTYFFICFEEGLNYGEWVAEQEKTCTQDGIYSRTDATTGLKQYMIMLCRGHDLYNEPEIIKEPTCTEPGQVCVRCPICGYQEISETSPRGHNFSGEYEIIDPAYGAKIGLKQTKCLNCDETKTKKYMDAIYPSGNIKIEFEWNNLSYVSSADREEIHWTLDENTYCYYIVRDASGHSSGNYAHFYFYYKDNGPHSPVYLKKMVGSMYMPRDQYGSYGWGIVGYVDSFEDFMHFIDDEHKGNDNGLNNTSLFDLYERWEDIFNEYGEIPSSYYCSGIVDYLGYTCRVYENDGFAYYVNEDNCCLYYTGKNTNRYHGFVSTIEEITEIPYGPVEYDKVKYIMIDIENGKDEDFSDQYYFQVESLYNDVEIYQGSYISDRKYVSGYETLNNNGEWVKIVELTNSGTRWYCKSDDNFTYMDVINKYFDGKYPDVLKIRAILDDKETPVHVTVKNGYVSIGSNDFGSDVNCLANEEITLVPDYRGNNPIVWKITINGETTEVKDVWSYTLVLPESGVVSAECVAQEVEKMPITINIIGDGKLNKSSGEYDPYEELVLMASANKGSVFRGWFVRGLFFSVEGDEKISIDSSLESYLEYGEYFGNKPILQFYLIDSYEDVVVTAVFEKIDVTKDYIDIKVTDGFICTYHRTALNVSAVRLSSQEYLEIHNGYDNSVNITGWEITAQTTEGPVTSTVEGKYPGYYFEYDSEVKPVYAN